MHNPLRESRCTVWLVDTSLLMALVTGLCSVYSPTADSKGDFGFDACQGMPASLKHSNFKRKNERIIPFRLQRDKMLFEFKNQWNNVCVGSHVNLSLSLDLSLILAPSTVAPVLTALGELLRSLFTANFLDCNHKSLTHLPRRTTFPQGPWLVK